MNNLCPTSSGGSHATHLNTTENWHGQPTTLDADPRFELIRDKREPYLRIWRRKSA